MTTNETGMLFDNVPEVYYVQFSDGIYDEIMCEIGIRIDEIEIRVDVPAKHGTKVIERIVQGIVRSIYRTL